MTEASAGLLRRLALKASVCSQCLQIPECSPVVSLVNPAPMERSVAPRTGRLSALVHEDVVIDFLS